MNALNDLTEVKFRERMRGYDYTEVDNYVETVSRAAAQAQERITELEHRLAQFESRPGHDEDPAEVRETLLRTLVLAQRTADTAVAEARSEAKSITDSARERAAKTVAEAETAANERLRSAEERAALMLAESEEGGQVIIAEAKRTAAAELASEREKAQEELHHLETAKEELEAVVAEIQARLDGERDMLRSLAVSFQSFVEKFEPVTDLDGPAGDPVVGLEESVDESGAQGSDGSAVAPSAPDAGPADGDEPAQDAGPADGDEPAQDAEATQDAGPANDAEATLGVAGPAEIREPSQDQGTRQDASGDEAVQEQIGALAESLTPDAAEPHTVPELPVVEWDTEADADRLHKTDAARHEHAAPRAAASAATPHEPHEIDTAGHERAAPDGVRPGPSAGGNGSARSPRDDSHHGDEAASAGPATKPFRVDSPELFDMDAEEDDEFIEQLRQVVSGDAPLPDTDTAMAAFFDHDEQARPEPPTSGANRSASARSRSGTSGRGGRLGPRG